MGEWMSGWQAGRLAGWQAGRLNGCPMYCVPNKTKLTFQNNECFDAF